MSSQQLLRLSPTDLHFEDKPVGGRGYWRACDPRRSALLFFLQQPRRKKRECPAERGRGALTPHTIPVRMGAVRSETAYCDVTSWTLPLVS